MKVFFYAGGEPIEINKLALAIDEIRACFVGYMAGVGDDITPKRLCALMGRECGFDDVLNKRGYKLAKISDTAVGIVTSVKLDDTTGMTATIRVEKDCDNSENGMPIFDIDGKYKVKPSVELLCDNGNGRELVAIYDIADNMFRVIRNNAIVNR